MSEKIKNPKTLRKNNKANIAFRLLAKGDTSRLRLSEELGLTGASITQLIKELLSENIVKEGVAIQCNNTGRKEVLISYNDKDHMAISVNIESDNTHISLCTYRNVIEEMIVPTNDLNINKGDLSLLVEIINKVIKNNNVKQKIMGVGVCVAGITDDISGISLNSYGILPHNFPLKERLSYLLNVDVEVSNNVRAQARALISDRNDNFMLIKHAPGLGCALIINGKTLSGADNRAGELGHTIAEYDGQECYCGKKGCLETVVSQRRIEQICREHFCREVSIEEVYSLSKTDNFVAKVMHNCMEKLAIGVINAATIINPNKILVTGGVFFDDYLRGIFVKKLQDQGNIMTKIELIENNRKIKAFAGARHILLKKLFEV